LDLANQAKMLKLVRERCTTCDSAAVVVTHDLNLAAEFADEVLVLVDGRIVALGAPEDEFTEEKLGQAFGLDVIIDKNPRSGSIRVTSVF